MSHERRMIDIWINFPLCLELKFFKNIPIFLPILSYGLFYIALKPYTGEMILFRFKFFE